MDPDIIAWQDEDRKPAWVPIAFEQISFVPIAIKSSVVLGPQTGYLLDQIYLRTTDRNDYRNECSVTEYLHGF